jgi:hypothetical protein
MFSQVYLNINLLSVVVANIALTLHGLASCGGGALLGQGSMLLGGTLADLCRELHVGLKCIVERCVNAKGCPALPAGFCPSQQELMAAAIPATSAIMYGSMTRHHVIAEKNPSVCVLDAGCWVLLSSKA